jgi:hypothetical protein
LAACERRFALRHAGLYLVACAPVAVFVILLVKRLIGTPYEVDQATVIAQIDAAARTAIAGSPWLSSATTQMGLFFKYLFLWLVPSTHWMAVDMHIDFAATSSLAWSALKVLAFFAYAAAGFLLLRRGGRAAVLGFGLLYPWVLFLVELASVRFQEPFVLYRTYLWAPGIIIALATGLTYLQRRLAIALAVAAMPLLALQAADRLESFSTPLALWEDAVAKLEPGVPGGHRPLFQLGRELLYADRPGRAIAVADQCIRDYPQTAQCYLARGTIDLYYDRYDEALPYLTRAIELDPLSGIAHHHRGLVLQEFGDRNGAVAEYAEAVKHGFNAGAYRLRKLAEQEKMRSSRRD